MMSTTDGSASERTATERTAPDATGPDRPAPNPATTGAPSTGGGTDSITEDAGQGGTGGPAKAGSALAPTRGWLVAAAVVPLAAWSASFLGSYVLQDFGCHAAAAADRTLSPTTLPVFLLVANAVLLVISLLCAVAGQFWLRRHTMEAVDRFLARVALGGGLLFGFSIILIGINPAVLEVCT